MARGGEVATTVDPRMWRGVVTTVESRRGLWPLWTGWVAAVAIASAFPPPEGVPWWTSVLPAVVVGLLPILWELAVGRPLVVVSDAGVAVGRGLRSALHRRRAVSWSDVRFVGPLRPAGIGMLHIGSVPLLPEAVRRRTGCEFTVARGTGTPLVVRGPLRGASVEDLHADVLARWERFGNPELEWRPGP